MMSNTLYVVLHIPLVDKSLQFYLFRIHNIPLVHAILKKLFRYSIQEEYLTIQLGEQYILFPLGTDILACQMENFAALTLHCMQWTLKTLVVMPFSTRIKRNLISFASCQS